MRTDFFWVTSYRLLWVFVVLALSPLSAQENLIPLDSIAAVVNHDVITLTELKEETATLTQELQARGANLPSAEIFQRQVLEKLVMRKVQLQQAERTGVKVADAMLNTTLDKMAKEQGTTLDQYRQLLEQEGYSFNRFREQMREEIIIKNLQQRYINSKINVTEKEIEDFLGNQARQGGDQTEYRLNHILIALPETASPDLIQQQQQKAEKIIAALHAGEAFQDLAMAQSDSNQALEGGDLGWRKTGQLPSLFANRVPGMKVGESAGPIHGPNGFHIIQLVDKRGLETPEVLQTRVRHILLHSNEQISDDDARTRLEMIAERLENGEEFAKLAQAYSEDKESAAQGGDLGWLSPGDMVPEFEEELTALQPGERTKIFKSRFGWHLAEVLQRRNQQNSDEIRRTQAAQHIRQRKAEEELQLWLRQLREEAYVDYRLQTVVG